MKKKTYFVDSINPCRFFSSNSYENKSLQIKKCLFISWFLRTMMKGLNLSEVYFLYVIESKHKKVLKTSNFLQHLKNWSTNVDRLSCYFVRWILWNARWKWALHMRQLRTPKAPTFKKIGHVFPFHTAVVRFCWEHLRICLYKLKYIKQSPMFIGHHIKQFSCSEHGSTQCSGGCHRNQVFPDK